MVTKKEPVCEQGDSEQVQVDIKKDLVSLTLIDNIFDYTATNEKEVKGIIEPWIVITGA